MRWFLLLLAFGLPLVAWGERPRASVWALVHTWPAAPVPATSPAAATSPGQAP